jgi:hypothetical protein
VMVAGDTAAHGAAGAAESDYQFSQ